MKSFWKRAAAAVAVLGFLGAAQAQEGLSLGDPAPAIDALEWVKGEAVDLAALKGKNVVLLDVFTVNDPRVPGEIKRLNGWAEKFGAAGLKVVGLATDPADDVKKFVGEHADIKYPVGVDNLRNTCGSYGAGDPPVTAIIDKDGRFVWRGYVANAEKTLEKVMAGKFDLAAAKKTIALEREMVRLINTQDPEKIEPACDAVLAHDPSNMNAVRVRKQCFIKRADAKAFREWIAKQVPKMTEADALNEIAWDIVTTDDLEWREPAAALAAAEKAVELTQGKESAIIDTLARVYYEVGLVDRAIETQKKAIAALGADTAGQKAELEKALAYYEQCAAVAKTLKPPAAPPKTPPKKK